jgi:glutathione S-transferase
MRSSCSVAGDDFTLGDLVWMPYLEYFERIAAGKELLTGRPHVAAWWARVRERPAWVPLARNGAQPPIAANVAAVR